MLAFLAHVLAFLMLYGSGILVTGATLHASNNGEPLNKPSPMIALTIFVFGPFVWLVLLAALWHA